jgi:hypothetical protein
MRFCCSTTRTAMALGLLLVGLMAPVVVDAFDYSITGVGGLFLADVETGIPGLVTIFTNAKTDVAVEGIEWAESNAPDNITTLFWSTTVDGILQDSGNVSLAGIGRELPNSIDTGTIAIPQSGTSAIKVLLTLSGSDGTPIPTAKGTYQVRYLEMHTCPGSLFGFTSYLQMSRVLFDRTLSSSFLGVHARCLNHSSVDHFLLCDGNAHGKKILT